MSSIIMENIVNLGTFGPIDLKRINACRIYLQVATLSKIAEWNGIKLSNTYKYIKDTERNTPYLWPK